MVKLKQSYGLESPLLNNYPLPVIASRAPTTSDKNFTRGQLWVDKTATTVYALVNVASGSATWSLLGPGASDVDTLTADSGGPLSPTAGNITLAGGTNITTVGVGSTITYNLDAAISLATSVTSPLYTAGAGVDLDITAPTGQDVVMKLGDAAGANKLSITDSADSEVFAVDSNGTLTFSGLTVAGNFAQTGGTFDVGQDNAADAISIGGGTTARAIGLGNSAAAHTLTIGSATGAASLDLLAGTGDMTLTGAATTAITLGQANQTETITLGNSTAGNTVSINSGVNTGAQVVSIANGATAANSTVNVLSGVGTAGAGVLNLANNTRVTTVDICDIAPAAARTVTICGGDSAQNDTVDIIPDAPSAGTQTVNVLSGTATGGTQALNLGTGATGVTSTIGAAAGTVNIDGTTLVNDSINQNTSINTGTSSGTVSIGNSAAGALSLDTAANISLDSATASNFTVTGAADLTLDSSAGSVNIDGGEADVAAVSIQASNGGGGIDCDSGSAGTALDSTGAISLDAAAASNFTVTGAGIDLTLDSAAGRVIINGEEAAANAITLLSAAGGIDADCALQMNLTSSQNAADAIRLNASAGGIDIDAAGAAGEDITLDNAAGSINLTAAEAVADAIVLSASNAAGGITIDAGSGGVNVTGSDLDVQGGDIQISGAAQQLQVEGGAATDFIGQTTLTAGDITISNTNIASTDRVFLTRSDLNASSALGELVVTISAGASFTITSVDVSDGSTTVVGDTSIVDYFIVRQL